MSQGETKTPLGEAVQKLPDVLEAAITDYAGRIIDSASQLHPLMDPGGYVLRPSIKEYDVFKRFIRTIRYRDDIKIKLVLPEGLQQVENYAFNGCTSLTSVIFPEGLLQVGEFAFQSCNSLTSVTFREGLKQVKKFAFSHCNSLTSVTFPEGLQQVGDRAFGECSSLEIVYVPEGMPLDRKRLGIKPGVKITHRISKRSHGESAMSNKRQRPSSLRF